MRRIQRGIFMVYDVEEGRCPLEIGLGYARIYGA